MRAWLLALPLLAFASGAVVAQPPPASIDCAAARSAIEQAICGGFKLRELDEQLTSRYRELLSTLPREAAGRLRAEQRAWLRERNRTCIAAKSAYPDRAEWVLLHCLQTGYEARISSFSPEISPQAAKSNDAPNAELPRLVVDKDAALCNMILAAAQDRKKVGKRLWVVEPSARYSLPVEWLPSVQVDIPLREGDPSVSTSLVPIDGKPLLLIVQRWSEWFRYTGVNIARSHLVAEAEGHLRWQQDKLGQKKALFEERAPEISQISLDAFKWRGRTFVGAYVVDRWFLSPIKVLEITSGTSAEIACLVEAPYFIRESSGWGFDVEERRAGGANLWRIMDGSASDEDVRLAALRLKEVSTHRASDERYDGENVLFRAVPYPALLSALLKLGMDASTRNVFGKTPLMYAAQIDGLEAVEILLSHGADVGAETYVRGTDPVAKRTIRGRTALDYGARFGGYDAVTAILRASPPLSEEARATALVFLRQKEEIEDLVFAPVRTAIREAH